MSARRLVTGVIGAAAMIGTAWVAEPFDQRVRVVPTAPAVVAAESRSVGTVERIQQDLLATEDDRLLTLVAGLRSGAAPYVASVDGIDTLVLTPRGLAYGLADLLERGAAVRPSEGVVQLERNVLVAPGASLSLVAPGTTLRLRSDGLGPVSLVAWKADLRLSGTADDPLTITSWDPGRQAEDATPEDGRPYVRTVSGTMEVADVHTTHLGFWAGRTGGIAFTGGSSGPADGSVTRATFEDGHYGVFASETAGLRVTDSRFVGNAVDGLSLHRHTVGTVVTGSTAGGNGRHGVSAAQGSADVTMTDVSAAGNAEYGVHLDGSPLSTEPSAGGASLQAYGDYSITGGELRDNGKAGIRITAADQVTVVGTSVVGNRDGVVLAGTASPTTVAGTTIRGDHRFGITTTGGAATISGNHIVGADTPIRVRDASSAVTGNLVERATNHGISVVGASVATWVVDNTLTGRGPSALDLHRLAPGVDIEQSGNDIENWVRDRDNWAYWSSFIPNHPLMLLWVVVLGVPLASGIRARRRRPPVGTSPYRDGTRRERSAPVRVHLGRPLSQGGSA